jgi:hypothetical protein
MVNAFIEHASEYVSLSCLNGMCDGLPLSKIAFFGVFQFIIVWSATLGGACDISPFSNLALVGIFFPFDLIIIFSFDYFQFHYP